MALPLGPSFARILDDYAAEVSTHPNSAASGLPEFIRGDAADAVEAVVRSAGWPHKVKGSAGVGVWAETPWAAAFDEDVTDTAQKGFYVVYLFRHDGEATYLTLDQGTTEDQKDFGRSYLSVLRQRADEAARLSKGRRRASARPSAGTGGPRRLWLTDTRI
jgi:5-methylcytosine-specific restriction protein A